MKIYSSSQPLYSKNQMCYNIDKKVSAMVAVKQEAQEMIQTEKGEASSDQDVKQRMAIKLNKEKIFIVAIVDGKRLLENHQQGMKTKKTIPSFTTEKEEREFYETHDSSEYLDWNQAKNVKFPNLKKSTKTISLRLPADMLEALKVKANSMDIPYQSLIKMFLQKELTTS